MSQGTVTAVVVSYNVRELLLQCLTSLAAAKEGGILSRIIVVDNASTDDSVAATTHAFPDIEIIEAPNLGYGGGANLGIARATTDYVLVLNPDTVVPASTVAGLRDVLDQHPDVAIAGPRMRYPDESIQSSRRRFPRRLTPLFESTIFERWKPENAYVRHYRMHDIPEHELQHVDWLVGACLMVRRSAIDTAGAFDPSFWMYCEEVEWSWRLRQHGWRTLYVPDVEIMHHEAASTSQDISRRQLAFDRSRVELQRRIYGNWTARSCATGIKAGYIMQAGVEAMKFVLGHRRDLRRNRLAQLAALIKADLLSGASRT